MHIPKRTAREQHRLKQREQIEASPFIATKFPRLKALKVTLEYYDSAGSTRHSELKCKLNLEHARSALWYACPGVECGGGDFDLSQALANAVAGLQKEATGELRCQGTRRGGGCGERSCQTLLRYRLNLNYD
jgi:hypothetical protein